MPRDPVTDANNNLQRTFATLADEVSSGDRRRFGSLAAASAGVPVPIFNRVFVFEPPSFDELSAAVDWMADRAVPFWVTATDAAVEDVRHHLPDLDCDLAKATEQPGMAMAPLDDVRPRDSVAQIDEVTGPDDLDAFGEVAASAFDVPLDVQRRLDRAALGADGMRPFLARVDGDPAACGLLVRTGDVAGLYNVGVVERYRRRGIGEATSRAVLRAGRDTGCRVGVLQSSEMGYPLYEKLGFETVVTYHLFEPAT